MNLSRNIGVLTQSQQDQLSSVRLVILGAGLGSNIAELAARSGFRNIVIVDGDEVAETNLNRQIYVHRDIGRKKVDALKERLEAIDPTLDIQAVDEFLSVSNMHLIEGSDIIVDSIDLSSVEVILEMHDRAKELGIPIVFPVNLGWKSMAAVFSSGSCTLKDFLGLDSSAVSEAQAKNFTFWARFLSKYVPDYGKEQFEAFIAKASTMNDWCPAPQMGVTVSATASLVVTLCIKKVLNLGVEDAPVMYHIDLFTPEK